MKCIGCGGEATGTLGLSGVLACKPCGDRFLATFDREPKPGETLLLPEDSPESRIASAVLAALAVLDGEPEPEPEPDN